MYESKMALAVKANGKVVRESGDQVFIPFGCEYSLLLKNLNSVRAIVKIWIDGTDVTEGTSGLIVPPNDSVDLERFIKNGNLHAGNKFKFIERTAQISNHRGNKIDDGLIRVEFEFEQAPLPYVAPRTTYWNSSHTIYGSSANADWLASNGTLSSTASSGAPSTKGILRGRASAAIPQSEVGITVAGAESSQSFTWGSWFPTDGVKHVMVLRMLGEVEGQPVAKPITVAYKPTCTSCGKVNKATSRFCSECGTALNIIGSDPYNVSGMRG